jgi:hypothetical protein
LHQALFCAFFIIFWTFQHACANLIPTIMLALIFYVFFSL